MTKNEKQAFAPTNRWMMLGVGVLLGFVWGSIMWGLVTLLGQKSGGVQGWLMVAFGMAMIGGGVSAIFGVSGARSRGERIGPRLKK